MQVYMYKVKEEKIIKCHDKALDKKGNYIIFDKDDRRPKIWIWNGSQSSIKDRYLVGVSSTSIKSKEGLYGSKVEVITDGSEPKKFLKLLEYNKETQYMDEEYIIEKMEVPIMVKKKPQFAKYEQTEHLKVENRGEWEQISLNEGKTQISEESSLLNEPIQNIPLQKQTKMREDGLFRQKVKSFLKEFSLSLETLQKQITLFLDELE